MGKSETAEESVFYRKPMRVREVLVRQGNLYDFNIKHTYPICPKCNIPMEYDYQNYCSHCGQKLSWVHYKDAEIRYAGKYKTASEV